jgi:hypothetical protein
VSRAGRTVVKDVCPLDCPDTCQMPVTVVYWNKLSPGRANVNSTTSSALTDMGGGATFFDNLVEVRPAEEGSP